MEIKWQRNQFIKFYAKMKIRVGGANPIDIQKGDEFEYDGSILKYAGAEFASPQTRGAVKEGWVTTSSDGDGGVASVTPSRNIAKATSKNTDLSRVQRNNNQPIQKDSLDEETVLDVSDRRPDAKSNVNAKPKILTKENNHRAGMRVETDALEAQEAVSIGRVRTSASFVGDITSAQNAKLKDKLENLTGSGFIKNTDGIQVKTNVGNVDRKAVEMSDDDGQVVGQVRQSKTSSEGITVTDTSNIRNKAKPEAKVAAVQIDTKVNPKIRVARRIDPSFPSDWSFTGKLAERLARVKDHGANPTFLEALYAAEGDQMRKLLEKEFPNQFEG